MVLLRAMTEREEEEGRKTHSPKKKMMLKAIKKTRIYEEVVAQILALIREGKLKPGDQLPSERELAETFQVSRTSVREAIRAMETQGVVLSRPGSGTFIAVRNLESIVQELISLLLEDRSDLIDIFEMRRLLEPHIAALAAERASPEDICRLQEIIQRQTQKTLQGGVTVEEDTDFHLTLCRATQNRALLKLISAVVDILSQSRRFSLQTPGRAQRSLASHREILEAVERHDPERAREAMQKHIAEVERNVFSLEKDMGMPN
ncbi:MAG: FadR family transcriptional regulator [Nitrospinota bacterium]|nr:MAG: FadR family transcriptional regulator [Nitrospinota bacterium]